VKTEGDSGIVFFNGSGERLGRRLSNPACLAMRFADGRLVEAREFVWDLTHVEAFWS
jgi:ketosteroid isomerase-like protein